MQLSHAGPCRPMQAHAAHSTLWPPVPVAARSTQRCLRPALGVGQPHAQRRRPCSGSGRRHAAGNDGPSGPSSSGDTWEDPLKPLSAGGAAGPDQRPTAQPSSPSSAAGAPGSGQGPVGRAGKGQGQGQRPESVRTSLERLFAAAEVAEPVLAPAAPPPPTAPSRPSMPIKWPSVDWSRYNLQLLFVDRTGTLRSRMAAGIFERIAEWNGWSRAMIPMSCGLHTSVEEELEGEEGEEGAATLAQRVDGMSRRAAVFTAGSSLGLFTGSLARPADKFGTEDLDFYDLVLVLDRALYDELMSQVAPEHLEHYKKKVCLLTSFSDYESEGIVLATGGLALLPRALSGALRPGFKESQQVVDVPSPDLASENSQEELGAMVRTLILACGGLCKYLMDSFPETASSNGPHRY